jgi:hypothetical protein
MLITGVFWGTWFTLTRSIESFSPAEFIHIGQVIIANVAMSMRFLMPAGILLMLLSVLQHGNKKSLGFYSRITALVLIVIVLLITLLVLVPIDNEIKLWTESTVPADWEAIRDKWQTFHAFHIFASLGSFAGFSFSDLATISQCDIFVHAKVENQVVQ